VSKHIKMKILKIYNNYDGSQIKPFWAREKFSISDDNIVVMIGSMDVKSENMIDWDDLRDHKAIKTDKAVHFLIEHYDSNDIQLAYCRQRIFCVVVKEILQKYNVDAERKGSDLYVDGKKLSVSIVTVGEVQKIHFGINLTTKGTPSDVETVALENFECFKEDKDIDNAKIEKFIDEILNRYIFDVEKIEKDIKKTRIFE